MTAVNTAADQPTGNPDQGEQGLRGGMGVGGAVFLVLAVMAPLSGVAGYAGLVIVAGNGLGAPSMFLLTGAVALVFSIGYVGLVRRVARPGAFYAYFTAALGKRIGLGGAFLSMVTYLLAEIGLLTWGGIAAAGFIVDLNGPVISWWVCALLFLAVASVLSYRNVAVSLRFLGAVLVAELLIVLLFDLVVAIQGGAEGITSTPFTYGAVTSGSLSLAFLFSLTLFSGWEATALYYEEMKDPQRTIARATYLIIGIVAVFYLLATWMLIVSFGESRALDVIGADYSGAFDVAVSEYFGRAFSNVIQVLILTSIVASVVCMNNMLTRYVYSLSVDGVAPAYFGQAHVRHGSPARASLLVSAVLSLAIFAVAATGLDANSVLAISSGAGTYGLLMILFVATVAIFVFFTRNPERHKGRQALMLTSSLVAGGIFAVMFVFVGRNLELVVGTEPMLAQTLRVILYTTPVVGFLFACYLAAKRPLVFARLGRQGFEDGDEAATPTGPTSGQ